MKDVTAISIRTAIAVSLITALLAISTVGQVPFTGELLVSGNNVSVNGEQAANGRTIIVPSTITTGPGSFATLNFGAAGRIQLAPNTTFSIDGNAAGLRGSLPAGSVTIVSAANTITITTLNGRSVAAKAGDVIVSDAGTTPAPTGPSAGKGGVNPIVYLLVAGAAVGLLVGVAGGGGSGGGGGTVSGTI